MKFIVRFLLSTMLMLSAAHAQSLLSGSVLLPNGQGFNGRLVFALAQNASASSVSGCSGPGLIVPTEQVTVTVTNGALVSPPTLTSSACTIPVGVPYNVVAIDTNGNVAFTDQWLISGNPFNVGTAVSSAAAPTVSYKGLWQSISTYTVGDIVGYGSPSLMYVSTISNNVGNVPGVSGTWVQITGTINACAPSTAGYMLVGTIGGCANSPVTNDGTTVSVPQQFLQSMSTPCTLGGGVYNGVACFQQTINDSGTLTSGTTNGISQTYNAYGTGLSGASQGPRGMVGFGQNNIFNSSGIKNDQSSFSTSIGVGDTLFRNYNNFARGGISEGSDQGVDLFYIQGGQAYGNVNATVTGGTYIQPTFGSPSGCAGVTGAACLMPDGGVAMDTTQTSYTRYFTGTASTFTTGCSITLRTASTTGTLPETTAWGCANGVDIPEALPTSPQSNTFTLTHGSGSFSVGDVVTAVGEQHIEQSTITAVSGTPGTQTVTLPLWNSNANISLWKGGLAGYFMKFAANAAIGSFTGYPIVGSTDGTNLIYATVVLGAQGSAILPNTGFEPETAAGASDPNSAFTAYCGSKIIATGSVSANLPTLEPNNCSFAVGHAVAVADFPFQTVLGTWVTANQNGVGSDGGFLYQIGGPGAVANQFGGSYGGDVENEQTNLSVYSFSGATGLGLGNLVPPIAAYATGLFGSHAVWQNDLYATQSPSNAVVRIGGLLENQTKFRFAELDYSGGEGTLDFLPSNTVPTWDVSRQGSTGVDFQSQVFSFYKSYVGTTYFGVVDEYPFVGAAIGNTLDTNAFVEGYENLFLSSLSLTQTGSNIGGIQFGPQTYNFTYGGWLGDASILHPSTGNLLFPVGQTETFGNPILTPGSQATTLYSVAGTALPTCNSGEKGTQLMVSDATSPTFLGTYAGSGTVTSPVVCNGTNWVTY